MGDVLSLANDASAPDTPVWQLDTSINVAGYKAYKSVDPSPTVTVMVANAVTVGNTVQGSASADTLLSGTGADSVLGSAGNDSVSGGEGDDTLSGGADADTLSGDAGIDSLLGGSGSDLLDGGEGADILDGGDDADTLIYDANDLSVKGGSGTDTLLVSNLAEVDLSTGPAFDSLEVVSMAGNGANSLILTLDAFKRTGGLTTGVVVQGEDLDTLVLSGSWVKSSTVDADNLVQYNITDASVNPSVTYTVKVNPDIQVVKRVTGSGVVSGDSTGNIIVTGASADSINAGGGDDTVVGTGGNDTMVGGVGTDTLDYSAATGNMTINMATGLVTDPTPSSVAGSQGSDVISEFENIIGGQGADTITGDDAWNVIEGGAGRDVLLGAAGNDHFIAQSDDGADLIFGGEGSDTLDLSALIDGAVIDLGAYTPIGTVRADGVTDHLIGVENVIGTQGADVIKAALGINILTGDDGDDLFVFVSAGAADGDVITDFRPGDRIDLSGIDAMVGTNGNQAFTLAEMGTREERGRRS